MRPEVAFNAKVGIFERIYGAEKRELLDYLRYLLAAYLEYKARQKSPKAAVYLPYLLALRVLNMQPSAQREKLTLNKISVVPVLILDGESRGQRKDLLLDIELHFSSPFLLFSIP